MKPEKEYLDIAVDNLENLYIDFVNCPYKKNQTTLEKRERARKRNEISALESRISKRMQEVQAA